MKMVFADQKEKKRNHKDDDLSLFFKLYRQLLPLSLSHPATTPENKNKKESTSYKTHPPSLMQREEEGKREVEVGVADQRKKKEKSQTRRREGEPQDRGFVPLMTKWPLGRP